MMIFVFSLITAIIRASDGLFWTLFPRKLHPFQMRVHSARQHLDLIAQCGQGRGVALGQLADAPGQRLADAV